MPPRRIRRRRFAQRSMMVLASTFAALAAGEFAARWRIEGSFLEAVDSVVGLRTAAEPGGRQDLIEDPDLGFRLNPACPGRNSLGLRGPEPALKEPGRFRLILIGDSVAFPPDGFFQEVGECVRLRTHGRGDAINAAVHGYTTWQERRFLERDLLPLRPDVVLLQYCVNDNYRFLHQLTSGGRRLMTLEAKNYLFPEGDGIAPWLTRSSYLVYSLRKLLLGFRAAAAARFPWQDALGCAAWNESTWQEAEDNFRAIATGVAGSGGRFAVIAFPVEAQLDPEFLQLDAAYTRMPQLRLGAICERLRVPFLDLQDGLAAHRADGMFTDGVHLSAAGHRVAGGLVVQFLQAHDLVPLH